MTDQLHLESLKIDVQFAVQTEPGFDSDRLIPVLHRWIQSDRLDLLAIDVTDYRHVRPGPGLLLVCHEGILSFQEGPVGAWVGFSRRRASTVSRANERSEVQQALGILFAVAQELEAEPELAGAVRVLTGDLRITWNDRRAENHTHRGRFSAGVLPLLDLLFGDVDYSLSEEEGRVALHLQAVEPPGLAALAAGLKALDPSMGNIPEIVSIPELALDSGSTESLVAPAEVLPVELPVGLRAELEQRGREGYPHEVCGLLVGQEKKGRVVVERVTQARNLATERLEDRYLLDPDHWMTVDQQAQSEGREIVGIWHTHPDHPAYPSETDREAAWEGYSYLILSVPGRGDTDLTAWRLATDSFLPQPIELETSSL